MIDTDSAGSWSRPSRSSCLATDARADDPCRPVTPACVTGADDRLQQAARAFTATESGGLLRGMGLASFTGLLGKKKGKAAEARLDDEIVSQLVGVERPVAEGCVQQRATPHERPVVDSRRN